MKSGTGIIEHECACGTVSQWPAGTPKTAIHCPACAAGADATTRTARGEKVIRTGDKGAARDKRR